MNEPMQTQSSQINRVRRHAIVSDVQALAVKAEAAAAAGETTEPPTELVRRRPRAAPHRSAYLSVLHGRHLSAVFELVVGNNILGRSANAAVRLTDHGISRHHASAVRDHDGSVKLVDLSSTNGTFINSRRIHAEGLREGDRIRIGPSAILRFGFCHPAQDQEPVVAAKQTVVPAADGTVPRGTNDAAIRVYLHTLRLREDKVGPNHVDLVELLDAVGSALLDRGAFEPAREHLVRALEIIEACNPPPPGTLAELLSRVGRCELGRGAASRALELLERALHLGVVHAPSSEELPHTRFAIARALRTLGRDPKRRLSLARQACLAVSKRGLANRELCDEVSRWVIRETKL